MTIRSKHYEEAERLLAEGVEVVKKIASAEEDRRKYAGTSFDYQGDQDTLWIAKRRDELGKKAMGIWAQAQVHATLATAPWDYFRESPDHP